MRPPAKPPLMVTVGGPRTDTVPTANSLLMRTLGALVGSTCKTATELVILP